MRLDNYIAAADPSVSRSRAKALILAGRVTVEDTVCYKPSFEVPDGANVAVLPGNSYVGRGAYKLEAALSSFGVDPAGKKCLDVGASTGGFTDVLLRRGAASVTAVDAGHGQLAESLRKDGRVRNIEGCNARYMTSDEVGDGYDLCVMDVSFISQTYIFPALRPLILPDGVLITLVKPQFELDASSVGRGVVRKPEARLRALLRVKEAAGVCGFGLKHAAMSPVSGGDGNTEYLFLLCPTDDGKDIGTFAPVSDEALRALSRQTPDEGKTATKR